MDSIVLDETSARQYLDRRLQENDVKGAIEFARKVQNKFPRLKTLLHFLGNIVVQVSTEDEEIDWYTVLAVNPSADTKTVQERYVELAKNSGLGSLEAHKLLNKAWETLSDKYTRRDYDLRRRSREVQLNAFVVKQASSATQFIQPPQGQYYVSGYRGTAPSLVPPGTRLVQVTPGSYRLMANRRSGPKLVPRPTHLI